MKPSRYIGLRIFEHSECLPRQPTSRSCKTRANKAGGSMPKMRKTSREKKEPEGREGLNWKSRKAYVKNGSAKSKIKYGSKNPDPEVEKFYVKKYGIEKMLESKSCLKQKFRE